MSYTKGAIRPRMSHYDREGPHDGLVFLMAMAIALLALVSVLLAVKLIDARHALLKAAQKKEDCAAAFRAQIPLPYGFTPRWEQP